MLEALAAGDGPLPVAAVLTHIRRPDVAAPVARASLSRTLRRLWAAGLLELVTGHATRPTLTEQAALLADGLYERPGVPRGRVSSVSSAVRDTCR